MITFKANLILEFEAECIAEARKKLKELTKDINAKVYCSREERLFDNGDL